MDEITDLMFFGGGNLGDEMTRSFLDSKSALGAFYAEYGSLGLALIKNRIEEMLVDQTTSMRCPWVMPSNNQVNTMLM